MMVEPFVKMVSAGITSLLRVKAEPCARVVRAARVSCPNPSAGSAQKFILHKEITMNKFFLLLTCATAPNLSASQIVQHKTSETLLIPIVREMQLKSISKQKTELAETYRAELVNGDQVHARYYLEQSLKDTIECTHYVLVSGGGINYDEYTLNQKYYHILKALYEKSQAKTVAQQQAAELAHTVAEQAVSQMQRPEEISSEVAMAVAESGEQMSEIALEMSMNGTPMNDNRYSVTRSIIEQKALQYQQEMYEGLADILKKYGPKLEEEQKRSEK